MDRPKCRIEGCTARHYSYEPHVFAVNTEPVNKQPVNIVNTPTVNTAVNTCTDKDAEIDRLKAQIERLTNKPESTKPKSTKSSRAAYMKAYMKRRREAGKA